MTAIAIRRLDHVCLRTPRLDASVARWCLEFGLSVRRRDEHGALLHCGYEPWSLELVAADAPGLDHVGWELARDCSLGAAAEELARCGVAAARDGEALRLRDPEGNGVELMPYRPADERWPAIARRTTTLPAFRPRKLGHVNFLTGDVMAQREYFVDVLGMRETDWLGDEGLWLHVNADHHVLAFVDKGYPHLHHLAFELVDWGELRVAFDHLAQHGRWLAWGPVRHGVGQNLCGYVRLPEVECMVELYCDMEQLERDHEPRRWPDNAHSSNTWGILPPRSYFRFDREAIEAERGQLEALGTPLP
jgi:catechol-2,3-dioxygenase